MERKLESGRRLSCAGASVSAAVDSKGRGSYPQNSKQTKLETFMSKNSEKEALLRFFTTGLPKRTYR